MSGVQGLVLISDEGSGFRVWGLGFRAETLNPIRHRTAQCRRELCLNTEAMIPAQSSGALTLKALGALSRGFRV